MEMRPQGQSTRCKVSYTSRRHEEMQEASEGGLTHAGVMRFLQLEWHSHERARNAWDIERAEMKAKIAKQEGEVRSAKKLNDQLNKHIRMLEQALMNERAKAKAGAAGANGQIPADEKKDAKGKKSGLHARKRAYTPIYEYNTRTGRDLTREQCMIPGTTPSSTWTPNSQKTTAMASARNLSCILQNASRK
jgi:hypothetical protein